MMEKLKKVGIVVDNYKIPKYMEELGKKGFKEGNISPCTPDTMSITLEVEESQIQELSKLLNLLEHQFKTN